MVNKAWKFKHNQLRLASYLKNLYIKVIFITLYILRSINIAFFGINIDSLSKPPDCESSPFKYNPAVHVMTGDLNIVENISLRNVFAKGPKFREPQSINWKFIFKILMNSVQGYARVMSDSGRSAKERN